MFDTVKPTPTANFENNAKITHEADEVVDAWVHLESNFVADPDHAGVFSITVQLSLVDENDQQVVAGRLRACRHTIAPFNGLGRSAWEKDVGDCLYWDFHDMSADAGAGVADLHQCRSAIASVMDLGFYAEDSVYIEHINVHPGFRGRQLALRMMAELARILLGRNTVVFMHACPMSSAFDPNASQTEGPVEPDEETLAEKNLRKRQLAKYYRSDEDLGFFAPKPRAMPSFLVALWGAYDAINRWDKHDLFLEVPASAFPPID